MSEHSPEPPYTPPDGRPVVDLPVSCLLCARHGEPFRWQWPKGYLRAVVAPFLDFAATNEELYHGLSNIEELAERLLSRPYCCRLTNPELMDLYRRAEIGVYKRCVNCKQKGLGTPYRVAPPGGAEQWFEHICFGCVLYNMRRRGEPEIELGPYTGL